MIEANYKDHRPRLNTKETQCVICGRIFGSSSTADSHAPWKRPVTAECKDPASLGMEFRDRGDGVKVWFIPMAPEVQERMSKMWAARRKVVHNGLEGVD